MTNGALGFGAGRPEVRSKASKLEERQSVKAGKRKSGKAALAAGQAAGEEKLKGVVFSPYGLV
ncbi:hypothetical protein [Saccharothrix australiensis]|uniref:hypothetical protein n=1 Tax=Saccharothrix australiensis TaxID=2072 RepID=UPI0011C47CD8|nr:hypothetical protein [Saccharothrix australiensis]